MDFEEVVDRASEPLLREYARAWKGLADSIRAIPDGEWRKGDKPGDVPARQACHLLFACNGYAGHRRRIGARFGVPVESFGRAVAPEDYPTREAVIAWIPEVEEHVAQWVRACTRKALTGARKRYSPLNTPVYVLRHTAVHLAYLRREMYRRGIPRPRY
ncbi:MAG: DinB family protein [Gemmatimonadota bacterium]